MFRFSWALSGRRLLAGNGVGTAGLAALGSYSRQIVPSQGARQATSLTQQHDARGSPRTLCSSSAADEFKERAISRDMRRLLRRLPSPVVVVTTTGPDGTLRGMTCSSFTSVSLAPPIVSFCISRPSSTGDVLLASGQCAVHILSDKQVNISNHFSKGAPPRDNKAAQFEGISHHLDPDTGLPILHGALGVVHCRKRETLTMGDHMVWFGDVTSAPEGTSGNPLVYYLRTYRNVGEEAFMRDFETTALAFDQWTHVSHVRMAWNYIQELGMAEALPLVRKGIVRYNKANAAKVVYGYNETITVFFVEMIARALAADADAGIRAEDSTFAEFLHRHPHIRNKSLIFEYYSKELLLSPEARADWVKPDLQPMSISTGSPESGETQNQAT